MHMKQAVKDMIDGVIRVSPNGSKHRWRNGGFEYFSRYSDGWLPCHGPLPEGKWRVPEEPAEPEVEKWKREGKAFQSPMGEHSTALMCMSDPDRFLGFEFDGYQGLFPRSVMWDNAKAPRGLSIYPPDPLNLLKRRVARAVCILNEPAR